MADIQLGVLTSTAVTARQVVLSHTPGAALKLKCIVITGTYTAYSATEANLGTVWMTVGGTDKLEFRIQNTDLDTLAGVVVIPLGDGLSFSGAEQIQIVVTPASTTSMRWTATLFYQ
jgi:hypothetical protein